METLRLAYILMDKLSAVIDFGGAAVGDSACDFVIVWTYLSGKVREIFISEMDSDTWLRASALWETTFELFQVADRNSADALLQKRIIDEVKWLKLQLCMTIIVLDLN